MTTTQNDLEKLIKIFEKLSAVSNAPFFTHSISEILLSELRSFSNNIPIHYVCEVEKDSLGTYCRLRKGVPLNKLVFVAHVDHPAIVLDSNGFGNMIGDVSSNISHELRKPAKYPVRVFSAAGDYLTSTELDYSKEGTFLLSDKKLVRKYNLKNAVAVWDLPGIMHNETEIRMRSCDNLVSVGVMFSVLNKVVDIDLDCDLTIVFPYVEEVLQLSMVGIALNQKVPTTQFDEDTVFIGVDVSPLNLSPLRVDWLKKTDLPAPSVNNGPLVQITDTELAFGEGSPKNVNFAEEFLLSFLSGQKYQHTICDGRSDMTPLTLYTNFGHIAGLMIPCRNVHNIDDNGGLASEIVQIDDVLTAVDILSLAVNASNFPIRQKKGISGEIKRMGYTNVSKMDLMTKQWRSVYEMNVVRLIRSFFFARNLGDFFVLALAKLKSLTQKFFIA